MNSIKITFLISLLLSATLSSCGQREKGIADKFMNYLNEYESDNIKELISDDFQVKRTFTTYTQDRASFLNSYLSESKNLNAKFRIIRTSSEHREITYLVEDLSDLHTYLKIDNPKWKIHVIFNQEGKIKTMLIESTDTYDTYIQQCKEKYELFESWLAKEYPSETSDQVYSSSQLFAKRLKEFANRKP